MTVDQKKIKGLKYLMESEWPSLPTIFIYEKNDIDSLRDFCHRNSQIPNWFLRGIRPVPDRYKGCSIVLKNSELAAMCTEDKNESLESLLPFCIQPYPKILSSGIALFRKEEVLVEFAQVGKNILKGVDLPMRCLVTVENGQLKLNMDEINMSKVSHPPEWLLQHVIKAIKEAPRAELENEQPQLAEWIATSEGDIYYVDHQIMPNEFLRDCSPLTIRPKVIYPGKVNFPVFGFGDQIPSVDDDIVLFADSPHIEIIMTCSENKVRGLLIKEGAWLSHVSRFAAETKIPCLFGFDSIESARNQVFS